jgi:hypothetical protein
MTWAELERCATRYATAAADWDRVPHADRFFSLKPEHAGKRGRIFEDYRDAAVADRAAPSRSEYAEPEWAR